MSLLFGRYRKIDIIGQGGMGTVFLAEDTADGSKCAIKEVPIKNRNKDLLLKEPNLLKKLNHKNIVKVKEIYDNKQSIFIVMDYIEGRSLKEALMKDKKFSETQVIDWAIQICGVLEYLHTIEPYPIVYRDIKPSNILVDKNNKITMVDFGIACELKDDNDKNTHVALTRGYCAPEQYIQKTFDTRSDIYSLGVTIYHLVTGVSPNDNTFELKPIRKVDEKISPEFEYIITKAIQVDPDERYQSIFDFSYDLININKLKQNLKKLVFQQILAYIGFALLYFLFIFVINLGLKSMDTEAIVLSNNLVTEGIRYLEKGDFNASFDNFKKAIKIDEQSPQAYRGLFEYYYQTARYDEGINYINSNVLPNEGQEHFKNIAELDTDYLLYRGKYLLKKGMYVMASNNFRRAYNTDTENYEIIYLIALSEVNQDYEEHVMAQSYISQLEQIGFDPLKIEFLYAEKHRQEDNFQDAITSYDKVIEQALDKELVAEAYMSKASIYKNNLDIYENGLDLFFLTLEEGESKLANYNNVNLILLKAQNYEERAKASRDSDKTAYYQLALESYLKLISIGKDEPEMYIKSADIYRSLNDLDNAENILIEAIKKYPEEFPLFYNLTVVQLNIEFSKDKSFQDFTKAKLSYEKTKELAVKQKILKLLEPLTEEMKKADITTV